MWRARFLLRPVVLLFWRVKNKELAHDQKRLAQQLAIEIGCSPAEIETTIFEVGVATLVGIALGKIPDSLKLKDDEKMWRLVQSAGRCVRAGLRLHESSSS